MSAPPSVPRGDEKRVTLHFFPRAPRGFGCTTEVAPYGRSAGVLMFSAFAVEAARAPLLLPRRRRYDDLRLPVHCGDACCLDVEMGLSGGEIIDRHGVSRH